MEDKKKMTFMQALKDGLKPTAERYGANKKPRTTPLTMSELFAKKKKKDLQSEE